MGTQKKPSLIGSVKSDPSYKKFQLILKNTLEKLDYEKSVQEAKLLHSSRTSRALTGNDRYSPKKIIDAALKDLSTRARLVEIRVSNDRNLSHLRSSMEAMRRYISTEYSEELRDFSTADQRKSFVDRVLRTAHDVLSEGDAVLEVIDHLIKDIDQSSHGMRHVVDCLKLLENKTGSKVL